MPNSASPAEILGPSVRRRTASAARAPQKGLQTRQAIVDAALGLATQRGLEGLSIGAVAERTRMSKSGVFAHFGSREELQISVIREYDTRFANEVFFPALAQPRGLPRLRALFENWMKRVAQEIQSGCIFISGAVEFDERPGPVRKALAQSIQTWLTALHRAVLQAQQQGHLSAEADARQIAFELHGLILALHFDARFLRNPGAVEQARIGFEHLLLHYGRAMPASATAAAIQPISKE